MDFYDRVIGLCSKKGVSVTALALSLGFSKGTPTNWKKMNTPPRPSTVKKIADYFGVSVEYLLSGAEEKRASVREADITDFFESMPIVTYEVIGSVKAGYDGAVVEEATGQICEIPATFLKGRDKNDFFVLRVMGDSMNPKLLENDLVFVQRRESVDSGDVAIVLYNGDEATIKTVRYKPGENWVDLIPCNAEYKIKRIEGSDLRDCRILGKVCKLIRDI